VTRRAPRQAEHRNHERGIPPPSPHGGGGDRGGDCGGGGMPSPRDRDRGGGERDHGDCGRPPLDPFDRRLEVGRDNVAHKDLVS